MSGHAARPRTADDHRPEARKGLPVAALSIRHEERQAEPAGPELPGCSDVAIVFRLVEQDLGTAEEMAAGVSAEEMAAGVSALLSPRFTVTTTVGDPAELLAALEGDELLLVAPRLWDRLPAAVREDERVLDVRHVIVPEELDRVWASLVRAGAAAGKPFLAHAVNENLGRIV